MSRGLHVGLILESPRPEVVMPSGNIIASNRKVLLCAKIDASPNLPDAKITFFIRMTKEFPSLALSDCPMYWFAAIKQFKFCKYKKTRNVLAYGPATACQSSHDRLSIDLRPVVHKKRKTVTSLSAPSIVCGSRKLIAETSLISARLKTRKSHKVIIKTCYN